MTCPECKGDSFVVENNSKWCTGCGLEIESHVQWTYTYSLAHHHRRLPVYSRMKRFRQWLERMSNEVIKENISDIVDVCSLIEFGWQAGEKKRTYFFNKNCLLFFVLKELGLSVQVKTLKDEERVKLQLQRMQEVMTSLRQQFDFL